MKRKCNTCSNWKFLSWIKTIGSDHHLRGVSHINFRTQCVIMTLADGGLSLMTFWNSEKLWNFKVHELSWTDNEFCTCLVHVLLQPINTGELSEKIILLYSLASKKQQQQQQTQATRRRKLEISNHDIQV